MKKIKSEIIYLLVFLFTAVFELYSQQPQSEDDDLTPESFSIILKNEWVFLRDGVEQLNNQTGKKGEFETTPEFQARALRLKQEFLEKVSKHIKETKLDRRIFGVWFKATLLSYDADTEIYSITTPTTIEAPYDIPSVECSVLPNKYVELADSILGGYRTSSIRLKFNPDFKWKVARTEALSAKSHENSIAFKVHFVINLSQENFEGQAKLRIIPKDIALINQQNKYLFWKEELK